MHQAGLGSPTWPVVETTRPHRLALGGQGCSLHVRQGGGRRWVCPVTDFAGWGHLSCNCVGLFRAQAGPWGEGRLGRLMTWDRPSQEHGKFLGHPCPGPPGSSQQGWWWPSVPVVAFSAAWGSVALPSGGWVASEPGQARPGHLCGHTSGLLPDGVRLRACVPWLCRCGGARGWGNRAQWPTGGGGPSLILSEPAPHPEALPGISQWAGAPRGAGKREEPPQGAGWAGDRVFKGTSQES